MNETYDYETQVMEDVMEYIREEGLDADEVTNKWERSDFEEMLHDKLWVEDSVTGNASGSYFCSNWKAENALCHNWNLLSDAIAEFGDYEMNLGWFLDEKGAEWADVTIRCYLLGTAISQAIDYMELQFKGEEEHE